MNYLNTHQFDLGAESQQDAALSVETLERRAQQLEVSLQSSNDKSTRQQVLFLTRLASYYSQLEQPEKAWQRLRPAVDVCIHQQQWQLAAELCNALFQSDHDDALEALGNGLWLAITFPVDPTLSVALLGHVINDTPPDSDGAAVAAAVAAYIVELRADQSVNDDATLAVGQMLNDVARRHSNVQTPEDFDAWFEKLELNQPDKFLIRMRNVIEVLVQDQWWFDRYALQQIIPEEG
jgi:hypothetical protein